VLSKPEVSRQIGAELDAMIAAGTVRPIVGARFPLDRASDAMRLIEDRGALGKVVLEIA
jgi:NADPH2:quinone reductase